MSTNEAFKRITCAAGAVLLTGLSSVLFIADEPSLVAIASVAHAADAGGKAQVNRGRYLVKIAGCNDCHTPGYLPRAGTVDESQWLVGDSLGFQGPWGTTYPANLRNLTQTLTQEQWMQVARRPMRPPMPWFALRDMTDEDLAAIYRFIRSLGPAGDAAPPYLPPGEEPRTPVIKVPPPQPAQASEASSG